MDLLIHIPDSLFRSLLLYGRYTKKGAKQQFVVHKPVAQMLNSSFKA